MILTKFCVLVLGFGENKRHQHIVDRWHGAVSNRPTASHTTEIDLAADEFLSYNPHRGGYHGMHVPGAYSIWHSLFFLIMLVLYS